MNRLCPAGFSILSTDAENTPASGVFFAINGIGFSGKVRKRRDYQSKSVFYSNEYPNVSSVFLNSLIASIFSHPL